MYCEPEKKSVRKKVLKEAVEQLTSKRADATIATLSSFKRVKAYLKNNSPHLDDRINISFLNRQTEESFKSHMRSFVGKRNPSELHVAYLAGPNPENDVKILYNLGILPENIWAFEMDDALYNDAVRNLLLSYPQIKIMHGRIGDFFEVSPITFDIVYLDFCGPLIPRKDTNRNIETLYNLFYYSRLSSIGCLITNFSYVDDSKENCSFDLLKKFISLYLYPKQNINHGTCLSEEMISFDNWMKIVSEEPEYFYGEFLRRFMMDLASIIVPILRLIDNKNYLKVFFNLDDTNVKEIREKLSITSNYCENQDEDLSCLCNDSHENNRIFEDCIERFSILWFLNMCREKIVGVYIEDCEKIEKVNEFNNNFYDNSMSRCIKNFLNQLKLNFSKNRNTYDYFFSIIYLLSGESISDNYLSKEMQLIHKTQWEQIAPPACDVFTDTSVIPLLVGQLTVPSHVNVLRSRSFSYKAKKIRMFTDVFVMDSCRYLYGMLPTIDMLVNRIKDESSQMCYRIILDSIEKNLMGYIPELFFGSVLVGTNIRGFGERKFSDRNYIN